MSDAQLVYGIHAVRAVLAKQPSRVAQIWVQAGRGDARVDELLELAATHGVKVAQRSARELDQQVAGAPHQGVVAQLEVGGTLGEGALDEILERAGPAPFVLVLDGVQDPHNL